MTNKPTDQERLFARALAATEAGDTAAAVATLEASSDPIQAGVTFADLSKRLYRERKDVDGMIAIGEAGITFCLRQAAHAADPSQVTRLKKLAKIIAFNTATNCWPGWGDEGIHIQPRHVQSGVKLAGVCRDLVRELELDAKEAGNADWLVGALELAAGRPVEALQDFQQSEQAYQTGGLAVYELMARGYAALARRAQSKAADTDELVRILEKLRGEGSRDAVFFADQLVSAEQILLSR